MFLEGIAEVEVEEVVGVVQLVADSSDIGRMFLLDIEA
jgi:hypothetical protein